MAVFPPLRHGSYWAEMGWLCGLRPQPAALLLCDLVFELAV